ncbi:MAG: glucuronate isomerase [Verrucomicrobia bacterium]|nr:glucuronate isomerase [Verrucomicrobiota bacterium]
MRATSTETATPKLAAEVAHIVATTPVSDIHTHLYDPAFGPLLLWGLDELLVYHYLVAEAFRYLDMPYDTFWALSKTQQADLVWEKLFVEHSPVSEACRGVLTVLQALGLDPRKRDLKALRRWFAKQKTANYITRCLDLAGVRQICMTNSPFDPVERPLWEKGFARDDRFTAALRIDPLLLAWGDTAPALTRWGYAVGVSLSGKTISEVRRFLEDWTRRIRARYLMVSLSPDFDFPADTFAARLLEQAVLPHCRDAGLPMALMFGVKRQVNPSLKLAGDGVGLSRISALENLCARFPDTKFLATALARENQHELCVTARKFRNLHVFGCWWFTNVPSLIEEITRMRLELIGLSVTPQHSDARVLDQIIYKWQHSRQIIARVLTGQYAALQRAGWTVTREEIRRDVRDLFGGAFDRFCRGS